MRMLLLGDDRPVGRMVGQQGQQQQSGSHDRQSHAAQHTRMDALDQQPRHGGNDDDHGWPRREQKSGLDVAVTQLLL